MEMMRVSGFGKYLLAMSLAVAGCAGGSKLAKVQKEGITAIVAAGSLDDLEGIAAVADTVSAPQVVEVEDLQGNRIVMNAVKDEETGEMVATEQLDEIVVTAKFRHVAERNWYVDLVFELSVPEQLQKRRWQVRFTPKYFVLDDTLSTDRIFITGKRFRRVQNWEYDMYRNYSGKIVPEEMADSVFTRKRLVERFVERGGVPEEAAVHYRKRFLEKINANRAAAQDAVYDRFVTDPFPDGGVRLDSVVRDRQTGEIRYHYVQSVKTRPALKRVDMVMEGEIYTNGRKLCNLSGTAPITFYISSISSFADQTERYMKKIVYRDLHIATSYNIEFRKGKWDIDPGFSLNGKELASIRRNISQILDNEDYAMDSILIVASGSPDGTVRVNERVSANRGASIKNYVSDYVRHYMDSASRSVWNINEDKNYREEERSGEDFNVENISVSSLAEDWDSLRRLIEKDTLLADKESILGVFTMEDLDAREAALARMEGFGHIVEEIYPKLRRVKFNFKLHRKGVVKDTVHTTQLDTTYMNGVKALVERDYKLAVTLLRPYRCYNTAVAFVCMDYNRSALEILLELPRDARRDYMLAVVYGRLGDETLAVQHFLNAVEQDVAMRHRGNLDPEISALIKKYGIN